MPRWTQFFSSTPAAKLGVWHNWCHSESVQPQRIAQPTSARDLIQRVAMATEQGQRIRMTGSGHAASDIAITSEILLGPDLLNKPLTLDTSQLKQPIEAGLVRVQSGIKIADLNRHLDQLGRALWNMGGYDQQTISGVMMTATHGSGLDFGPMADQVVSLQLVIDGGQMLQIEPADGITDPALWTGHLPEDPSIAVELIQDDDAFHATRVAIGSMGILYAVVLRTDQKYWLREVRQLIKWSALSRPDGYLDRIIRGLPVYTDRPVPAHWELQYSPYPDAGGDYTFLITERHRSYSPLPEQPASQRGARGTELASTALVSIGQSVADLVQRIPAIAPRMLAQALQAQVCVSYSHVSYKVFNIGVVNDTPAVGIEAAFDLSQTIAAIERSFSLAQTLHDQGMPHTSPIAIRFVKKSSALIAMQHGRDTMFMEVIAMGQKARSIDQLRRYQQVMLDEFGARPHWGLDFNLLTSARAVAALYPDSWPRWLTQLRCFNPHGTFDGKVTDRLGISVARKTA